MTVIIIEREKLTEWAARINTASTILYASAKDAVAASVTDVLDGVCLEMREELNAGADNSTAEEEEHNCAREGHHGKCKVCGKEAHCKKCTEVKQDTSDGEEHHEECQVREEEPVAAPQSKEPECLRNGTFAWMSEEESVLRTFKTVDEAIEKANLPGRTDIAIRNKWYQLKRAGAILERAKPFRYIGSARPLFDRMGIILSYTDDRTRVNAEMLPDRTTTMQIDIANITQVGIL